MNDSKFKSREIDEKYDKFKKDISNERMFLFLINNLFSTEFQELIEDILILDESQFFIQIKNRVEAELEEIYSEKIFSDQKYKTLIEKGVNSIKSEYNQNFELLNNTYNTYTKNRNKTNFLTSGYRRHCINEVDNNFATHTCNAKLGKFILVEKNGKIDSVICSNCKKVYYDTMILCKCYKCNIDYYTEIFQNNEDEFILPATWDNYHCKQIAKEKIKCIKCREILYINLKNNMLQCLNKNCNFTSKPNKILWTCSICNQDFKSGAMPYNPLELEVIKKIIKQTLYLKQYAHPKKVPCCKVNVFFSEFYHKKKCDGVLYSGELNHEVIIVCEKCHAINFYERFIWTCPKCGNQFRDENDNNISLNDENSEKDNNFKSNENRKKSDKYNIDEEISSNSNNSKNKSNKESSYHSKKYKETKEISAFNLEKNIISEKPNIQKNKSDEQNNNNDDRSIKKTKSMRYKKKLNDIYYEREKEKKEKEPEKETKNETNELNLKTEYNNKSVKNIQEQNPNNKRKRSRFYGNFITENKEPEPEQEKIKEETNENEQKRKIEKTPLNIFSKFRKNRKSVENEQKPEEPELKEIDTKIKANKKDINDKQDKAKDVEIKKNYPKSAKRIVPYRSFKRNINHNLNDEINNLNKLQNEKKDEEKEKILEPKKASRKRFLSNIDKVKEQEKEQEKEKDKEKEINKIINNQKIENGKEIVEKDVDTRKTNSKEKEKENKQEIKNEEIPSGFSNRWKFRHQEQKKTSGKEIKEETSSTSNSIKTNNTTNNTNNNNKTNNSNEENNNSQSPEKPDNNTNKDNKKNNVKMSKIPGMSETLYNHINNRINNIISKCSIPLMNVEDYTLVQKIGEGSYGIIFKAISKKDKTEFALKKIISNKLQKISEFIKEFELVYSCHHDNIMKIFSYCIRILDSTTYALYVLMELSSGDWDKEIRIRLMQGNNYSEKELINILFQLSSSLLYIQQNFHISHRDIKPQNVLVFPNNKYKLADFGEAKEAKIMRQRNTLRGTELFMSPALYDGLKHEMNDVSHNPFKSDVFSLGYCFIYAAALNFNLLYQVRDIVDNKNINMILHKFLGKHYSEKFIVLLASMLEMDESKRYDFIDIKNYVEKNFDDMVN